MTKHVSRRAFVSASAATLAGTAVVATPLGARASTSDANLLHLGDQWRESARRCRELYEKTCAAEDRLDAMKPEAPQALFWRPRDWQLGFLPPSFTRDGRTWYGDSIDDIRSMRHEGRGVVSTPERRERTAEIISAYEGWQSAIRAAEVESGFVKAAEAEEAAQTSCRELRQSILATQATTLAGFAVKAEVAAEAHGGGAESLASEIAKRIDEGETTGELIAWSLVLDLVRSQSNRDVCGEFAPVTL